MHRNAAQDKPPRTAPRAGEDLTAEALAEAVAHELAYDHARASGFSDAAARAYADGYWEDWADPSAAATACVLKRLVGRIDNDAAHKAALARLDHLLGTEDPHDGALLALLAEEIERYETRRFGGETMDAT